MCMGETKLPIDQTINTFILQPIRKVRKKKVHDCEMRERTTNTIK